MECINCKTSRREIRARGYCTKCYPLILLREKIEKWTFSTINQIPSHLYPQSPSYYRVDYFKAIKKGYMRKLTDRLDACRYREESYKKGTDGISIEHMLRRLGKRLSRRYYADRHYGHASRIDWKFPPEQKRELYRLLLEIEETIPWRGLS